MMRRPLCRMLTCLLLVTALPHPTAWGEESDWDKQFQKGMEWWNKDYLWEAQKSFEKCLADAKDFKADDPRYVQIRVALGIDYLLMSKNAPAEGLLKEAIAAIEKKSGSESSDLAIPLTALGFMCAQRQQVNEVIKLHERVQKILEHVNDDKLNLDVNFHQAEVLLYVHQFSRGEIAGKRAYDLWLKSDAAPSKSWTTSSPVDILMRSYLGQNKLVDANDLLAACTAAAAKLKGPDSSLEAEYWLMGGHEYQYFGKCDQALKPLERALELLEKQKDKKPQEIGITHYYIAFCLTQLGRLEDAKKHLPPAMEGMKNYPARQVDCRQLLYQLCRATNDLPGCEKAIRAAIGIDEKQFAHASVNNLENYSMLGECLMEQLKYDAAETAFNTLLEIARACFGKESRAAIHAEARLIYVHVLQKKDRQAFEETHDLLKRLAELQPGILATLKDHNKLALIQSSREPWEYFFSLALRLHDSDPATIEWLHQAALSWSGLALDSSVAEQQAALTSGNAELEKLRSELAHTRQTVATLYTRTSPGNDTKNTQRTFENAVAELDRLDAEFAEKSAPYASIKSAHAATIKQIQERLPAGTAVVAIFPCTRWAFKIIKPPIVKPVDYLALVMTHERLSPLIDLGSVTDINAAHEGLQSHLYEAPSVIQQKGEAQALAALRPLAARVSELVLKPLWPELKDSKRWLFALDGELATLPVHMLPVPDVGEPNAPAQDVLERFEIAYVNSARDVMFFGKEPSGKGAVVISGPDFNLGGAPEKGEFFKDLPGAREEGEQVAAAFKKAGVDVTVKSGADAKKSALFGLQAPRFLHISTHGYYLPEQPRSDLMSALRGIAGISSSAFESPVQLWLKNLGCPDCGKIHDPLMRSGLALAGANRLQPAECIATARELVGLNLWGTELVVLSACETGTGVSSVGEGVIGLRRSFTLSGCQRVLSSLWPIPDRATRDLMSAFYTHRLNGEATAAALRNAMLEIRKTSAHPFFWAGFVLVGDPN